MNECKHCEETKKLIHDYLNGSLDKSALFASSQHISDCSVCTEQFKIINALKSDLTHFKPHDLACPEELKAKMRLRIAREAQKKSCGVVCETKGELRKFLSLLGMHWQPVAAGCVALVVVAIAFVLIRPMLNSDTPMQETLLSQSEVPSGEPVLIKLQYTAEADLDNVTFTVLLDDGLSFDSESREITSLRSHEWRGSLKKGMNEIPLVLHVSRRGTMNMHTKAVYQGTVHEHRVELRATATSVVIAYYLLPSKKVQS